MPYNPPPIPLGLVADAVPALVGTTRGSALGGRIAVWHRQPAGVLCIELLEIRVAPSIVELEQDYLALIAQFISDLIKPLGVGRMLRER
jgi:hypothetical protein